MACKVCLGFVDQMIASYENLGADLYRADIEAAERKKEIIQHIPPTASRLRAVVCFQILQALLWHRASTVDLMRLDDVLCSPMGVGVDDLDLVREALRNQREELHARGFESKLMTGPAAGDASHKLFDRRVMLVILHMLEICDSVREAMMSSTPHNLVHVGDITAYSLIECGVRTSRMEGILAMLMAISEKETIDVWNTIPEYLE